MKQIYIIEHLEKKLWPWCVIEYKHISKIVGKNNLWITNIKESDKNKLIRYACVFSKSVRSLNLKNSCILDPEAKKTLNPKEAKSFSYFIFGGILGDFPPKKRTKKELTRFIKNAEKRNIGKEQFSTDNAVYVVREIAKGKKPNEMNFQDSIKIKINKILTTELPYRYLIKNKKPLISRELIKYIKKIDAK